MKNFDGDKLMVPKNERLCRQRGKDLLDLVIPNSG